MVIKFPIDDLYQLEKKNYSNDRIDKIRTQLLKIEEFKKYEDWFKSVKNVIAINYTMAFLASTQSISNVYKLFKCDNNNDVFNVVINENNVPYEINNNSATSTKDIVKISVSKNGISSVIDVNIEDLSQNFQQEKDGYLFVSEILSTIIKSLKN